MVYCRGPYCIYEGLGRRNSPGQPVVARGDSSKDFRNGGRPDSRYHKEAKLEASETLDP